MKLFFIFFFSFNVSVEKSLQLIHVAKDEAGCPDISPTASLVRVARIVGLIGRN